MKRLRNLAVGITAGLALGTVLSVRQEAHLIASGAVPVLEDPQGVHSGLGTVPSRARARVTISRVRAGEASSTKSYDRSAFGTPWTDDVDVPYGHDGCSTRDDVLRRDLSDETFRPGSSCVVASGTLDDPYTGRTIEFSKSHAQTVQIDHVVALHYAWEHGASNWSSVRRKDYANDPLVLLAVDGPENVRKSDKGPASWQPPNRAIRCSLATRQTMVVLKYRLTVARADKTAMRRVCR